jgi:glycosyltransferase, family 1
MINIGFVHGRYPYGGGEKITSNIAPYLKELGYRTFVFSSKINQAAIEEKDRQHITFIHIDKTHFLSPAKVSLADKVNELDIKILVFIGKAFKAGREGIFKKTDCKCIFAHYGMTFWQLEDALERLQTKAHTNFFNLLWYGGVKIPLYHLQRRIKIEKYRYILNHYHAFSVLCEAYKEELTSALHLTDNHKIVAVPMGLLPLSKPYSLEKKKHLLYIGRMSYMDKRVDRLVEIWQHLYKDFPDWEMRLVGEGPELPHLRQMAADYGLERITFYGRQESTIPFYNEAAIFCLSSQIEGAGLVLIEAQQAGLVPIAFSCSAGVRELLAPNGVNGFVVPNDNIEAYVTQLCKLMTNPELRTQIQQNVLKNAENYAMEPVVAKWDAMFKQVLNN